MDWFDHSDYGIIPAGNGLNAIRQYNKTADYAEKLLWRDNYYVWLVRMENYRHVCRDWALKKYKQPTIPQAIELCGQASAILNKPIPRRKKADGTLAHQWLQRWLRAELHLLKFAAQQWLAVNATTTRKHYVLSPEENWMSNGLSEIEMDHAWSYNENDILVRSIKIEKVTISVPLLHEIEMPEDAEKALTVPNHRMTLSDKKPEDVMKEMWRFLPTKLQDSVYDKIAPESPLFPEDELIARNPKGGPVMAQWIRIQKYKLDRESMYPEERQKRQQQRDRAIRALKESNDKDVFGF